jgi:hypothetical protein
MCQDSQRTSKSLAAATVTAFASAKHMLFCQGTYSFDKYKFKH